MARRRLAFGAMLLCLAQPPFSLAQAPADTASQRPQTAQAAQDPRPTLPSDSTTEHVVELPNRTLRFTATAGSIPFRSAEGRLEGEMAYVYYRSAAQTGRQRPVTFAMNGGPGSASAWLHLGVLGPWRLPMDGEAISPSAMPVAVPNAETWLDFTDLVFIDPIGTGFSRLARSAANDNAQRGGGQQGPRNRFWSVNGDIESITEFISLWLQKHDRHASPKVFLGESYGGFRAPKVAAQLQTGRGVGLNAIVLVSPVIDYNIRAGRSPIGSMVLLPSIAAAAMEERGIAPSRAVLADAETFARTLYLDDILKGPRDQEAVNRLVQRVSALSGLPESVVRRYGGRLDGTIYRREANLAKGRVASAYDASVTGFSPDPTALFQNAADPFTTALAAPLTTAMLDLYANRLKWKPDGRYFLSGSVQQGWFASQWTNVPDATDELRAALALDPKLQVLVVHGFTDLVTPYFASQVILDQLPAFGDPARVRHQVYPGGHMFYNRAMSRIEFRNDGEALVRRIQGSVGQ